MAKNVKIGKTIIITAANMDKEITSLAKKSATIDKLIHRLAVSGLYHAKVSGDSRSLFKVREAMPKSSRRKALDAWIVAHGAFEHDQQTKKLVDEDNKLHLVKGRTDDDWNIEDAEAKPFWEFTAERAPVPMTVDRAVNALLKSLGKVEGITFEEEEVKAMVAASISVAEASNDDATDNNVAVA